MAKAPVSQLHCTIQSSQVDTLRELKLVKSMMQRESDPQPPRARSTRMKFNVQSDFSIRNFQGVDGTFSIMVIIL